MLIGEDVLALARQIGDLALQLGLGITRPLAPYWSRSGALERILVAYAAWLGYKKLGSQWSLIKLIFDKIFNWFKLKYFQKIDYDKAKGSMTRIMEAVRPGSFEMKMTPAKCQCMIGKQIDGKLVPHGCGFRLRDFLVLPDHVLSGCNSGGDEVYAFTHKTTGGGISLLGKEVKTIDTDLVYIKLSPADWGVIGTKTATIYRSIPDNGCFAQIVGCMGEGTVGELSDDPQIFGRTVYSGTTVPGYSGAPYMVANRIAGMHQVGSAVTNGGFSATYIWSYIKYVEGVTEEETKDWLKQQWDEGNYIDIDQGWGDVDTVRIKVSGTYHIVDRMEMNSAFGGDWRGKSRLKQRKPNGYDLDDTYPDEEMESLNRRPLVKSGDSKREVSSPGQDLSPSSRIITEFSKLSKNSKREMILRLRNYHGSMDTPQKEVEKSTPLKNMQVITEEA
uniref:Serine protease n=1 Tax=Suncus murinus ribovirus 5 TaxID=3139579 RepID=A0AB38ZKE6_9VIRU